MSNPNLDGKKLVSLPIWAIVALLIGGAVSVLAAPGALLTVVWTALLAANVYFTWKAFGSEVQRLKAVYKPQIDAATSEADKQKLRSDIKAEAKKVQRVPMWQLGLLVAGSIWAAYGLIQIAGFLIGLVVVVAILAGIGVAAYFGYRHAEKKGYIK